MKPSLTRSVVESRKAPKGVDLPPARASAPSRMSSTRAGDEERRRRPSRRGSGCGSRRGRATEAAAQSETPAAVSAFGVTRVRARPTDRAGSERARTGRVALLDRGGLAHVHDDRSSGSGGAGRAATGRRGRRRPGSRPTCRRSSSRSARRTCPRCSRPRSGCRSPSRRTRPRPARAIQNTFAHQCLHEAREHDPDDQRVAGMQARHRRVRVRGELDDAVGVAGSTKPTPSSRGGAIGMKT